MTDLDGHGAYRWSEAIAPRREPDPTGTRVFPPVEPHKIRSRWMRALARLGGVTDPDGGMPLDLRLGLVGQQEHLRQAVRTMSDWNPERVILAHNRWYERDGAAELRRAFRWLH